MNIDWNLIKRKYPKAYEKFLKTDKYNYGFGFFIPKDICFCDIEKFFDSLGIITEIVYCSKTFQNIYDDPCWYYIIQKKDMITNEFKGFVEIIEKYYFTRQEAKEQAILKAFEILENKLKGVKK
jgi:hypothetical protein